MILHGRARSSASWRVRIGLAFKGLDFGQISHDLQKQEQSAPAYLNINPQGLVPTLILDDGSVLTQSLAILEFLEQLRPQPALLPANPVARAHVRAAAQVIACDIHPVQNLKIIQRVRAIGGEEVSQSWARQTIEEGLSAFATLIANQKGPFCFGASISLADVCLVPQLTNARRFGAKFDFGRIAEIEKFCMERPEFSNTRPEIQSDFE